MRAWRAAGAAACALAAHALLYGTFLPTDGLHGYFRWYEPAVAALGAASVLGLAGLLALASLARRAGRRLRLAPPTQGPVVPVARSIAATALGLLLAQEALERSVAAGHPAFAILTPFQCLVAIAAIAASAAALALALRAGRLAVRRALAAPRRLRAAAPALAGWSLALAPAPRRGRPLAERFGLRAPPAFARC